jgi:hypothetical protein
MNALLKCTPGPYINDGAARIQGASRDAMYDIAHLDKVPPHLSDCHSRLDNARLLASAYDHALVASALASRKLTWEQWEDSDYDGELCFDGIRYYTELDDFGVPFLTDDLRAELIRAMESEQ